MNHNYWPSISGTWLHCRCCPCGMGCYPRDVFCSGFLDHKEFPERTAFLTELFGWKFDFDDGGRGPRTIYYNDGFCMGEEKQ